MTHVPCTHLVSEWHGRKRYCRKVATIWKVLAPQDPMTGRARPNDDRRLGAAICQEHKTRQPFGRNVVVVGFRHMTPEEQAMSSVYAKALTKQL